MSQRLFEAMIQANHRALAGDSQAGLHPSDFPQELPLVALTCVDARLNLLLPQALGVPPEQFIWLRNAGNIVTGPLSSTMRSLALACAVKGGKEIVIIGHTDCQVGKTTTLQLLECFRALGVERHHLPDNLNEYFGLFGSDRQNVIQGVQLVRSSPLIGSQVPVQGLLVDIETGRLEWLVNGYETLGAAKAGAAPSAHGLEALAGALAPLAGFNLGELKFPETKIGDLATTLGKEILQTLETAAARPSPAAAGPLSQSSAAQPQAAGSAARELNLPRPGDALADLARELARNFVPVQGPGEAKASSSGGAPPKIPIPPRIRVKPPLRSSRK